jgi:hypothetical protein
MSTSDTVKTGAVGLLASAFTWVAGAFNWYTLNLHVLNDWIVHIAQLGGLVVLYFSIRILRRNWTKGINSIKPLD